MLQMGQNRVGREKCGECSEKLRGRIKMIGGREKSKNGREKKIQSSVLVQFYLWRLPYLCTSAALPSCLCRVL